MLPLIKFIVTVAIWFFVIRLIVKKREAALKSSGKNDSENMPDESSFPAVKSDQSGSVPDISLWRRAASELSGKLTMPFDKSGLGLAVTGTIGDRPFRIEFHGNNRIFYALTLPYAPPDKIRTFPLRCVSDAAILGDDTLFILCPGTTPEPAVIKELAAHAGRILSTIPFEEEPPEERPGSAFRRKQNIEAVDEKTPEPVSETPEPVAAPKTEPVAVPKTEPVATPRPEPAPAEERQEPPAPADSKEEEKETVSGGEALSPESLAEVLFRSVLPGPAEKEYFASLTGRRVEWTGTVRMAYEISSDFVFGRVKGVKVQMDLCTVAGKYGRQTLRGTAIFPPESYAVFRTSSNKTIRFRGTILKLEAFSREVYLSEGELL